MAIYLCCYTLLREHLLKLSLQPIPPSMQPRSPLLKWGFEALHRQLPDLQLPSLKILLLSYMWKPQTSLRWSLDEKKRRWLRCWLGSSSQWQDGAERPVQWHWRRNAYYPPLLDLGLVRLCGRTLFVDTPIELPSQDDQPSPRSRSCRLEVLLLPITSPFQILF